MKTIRAVLAGVLLAVIVLTVAACGGSETTRSHRAVPTYQSKNYIERQIFNHRLAISDDPSTVLFCTSYPFDAPPKVSIIAGKLVSGQKRPDPLTGNYEHNSNGYTYEKEDAQGMYGQSSPYRFGFTPGGQYKDYSEIPAECSTEAVSTKETKIGKVEVRDNNLTKAGEEVSATLKAGLIYKGGQFSGYTPEAKQKAQAIINQAISASEP